MNRLRVLKVEEGYKIYPPQEGRNFMVGKIPLHWLVYYLSRNREFTKDLAVNHIQNYYDIDISEVVDSLDWWDWIDLDIYENYTSKKPRSGFDTSDRRYFESKGRKYFLEYIKYYWNDSKRDFFNPTMKMSVVHHIYPLVFGGTNKLENLVQISDFHHDILHANPLENHEKYCHQAVDYLWYLYSLWDGDKNVRLIEKYKLGTYDDEVSQDFKWSLWKGVIRQEMMEFYEYLKENHKS